MKRKIEKLYYSTRETAVYFGVSPRTVERWRASGCPCHEMKAGAGTRPAIRYIPREVERFIFVRDAAAAHAQSGANAVPAHAPAPQI